MKLVVKVALLTCLLFFGTITLPLVFFFGLQLYFDQVLEKKLETDLANPWKTSEDKNLNYSFSYPNSWKAGTCTPGKGGKEYSAYCALNIWDQGGTFVTIYKKPSQERIKSHLDNKSYIKYSKVINGIELTALGFEGDFESGLGSGRYLISKDGDLLIYIINGYKVDNSLKSIKLGDDIIQRILNSIKRV